jgi:hypothetical protein
MNDRGTRSVYEGDRETNQMAGVEARGTDQNSVTSPPGMSEGFGSGIFFGGGPTPEINR